MWMTIYGDMQLRGGFVVGISKIALIHSSVLSPSSALRRDGSIRVSYHQYQYDHGFETSCKWWTRFGGGRERAISPNTSGSSSSSSSNSNSSTKLPGQESRKGYGKSQHMFGILQLLRREALAGQGGVGMRPLAMSVNDCSLNHHKGERNAISRRVGAAAEPQVQLLAQQEERGGRGQ
jgi:hypothetical protein